MPEPKVILSPLAQAEMDSDPELAKAIAHFSELMKSAMQAVGPMDSFPSRADYERAFAAKLAEYGVESRALDLDEEEEIEARMAERMEHHGISQEEMDAALEEHKKEKDK